MSKRMKNKSAKIDLKLKCGACGGKGHMRTNKACPKFVPDEFDESLNTSFTEREVNKGNQKFTQEKSR